MVVHNITIYSSQVDILRLIAGAGKSEAKRIDVLRLKCVMLKQRLGS